jgi:AcrR family transcriptional regulator
MPRTGLTSEDLKTVALDAAEKMIRRFGFEKTRLVDIAKEVGVSHPVLYRIFPDKAALFDAVSERWLRRIDAELAKVTTRKTSPSARIHEWFLTLYRLKREKVSQDPELYRAFNASAERQRPFIVDHLNETRRQLRQLATDAIEAGEIARRDPDQIAQTLFEATMSFHHPRLLLDQLETDRRATLKIILNILLAGLAESGRSA